MNAVVSSAWVIAAATTGGLAVSSAVTLWSGRNARAAMKAKALQRSGTGEELALKPMEGKPAAVRYAARLTRRLFIGSTTPLASSVRSRRAGTTRAGVRFKQIALKSGCAKEVTVSAYCEACTRLMLLGFGTAL